MQVVMLPSGKRPGDVKVILIDSLAKGKLTIADSAFSICSIVVF